MPGEIGFDIATTADQFVDWKNPTIPWFDVWATLAALAEATNRIRLAPCVAQIPMRDPATYARSVLTIDHISGGRIEAGLGLGLTADPGYGMIGVQNWDNPQRAAPPPASVNTFGWSTICFAPPSAPSGVSTTRLNRPRCTSPFRTPGRR